MALVYPQFKLIKLEHGYGVYDSFNKIKSVYDFNGIKEVYEQNKGNVFEDVSEDEEFIILFEFDEIEELKEKYLEEFI